MSTPIVFLVPGRGDDVATRGAAPTPPASLPLGLARGRVKQTIVVGTRRGGGGDVRVAAAPDEDVVVLEIAGGPALVLHPESARDLMLAQAGITPASRGPADVANEGEVRVPQQLQWAGLDQDPATRGTTRGLIGNVLIQAVHVLTGIAKDRAVDWTVDKIVAGVDGQVDAGVYQLAPDTLPKLKGRGALATMPFAPGGGPLLVLVHGTFVDTASTFGKLWTDHPSRVRTLFESYGGRVFGLDHPTLGKSPIDNALTLANACPQGARLHLATHSRGGLVAEVLARACATRQLGADGKALFAKSSYASELAALEQLIALVNERDIHVDRVVRVACPARGTLLASRRLDAYLSVFKWLLELAKLPILPELVDFLAEVAQHRTDPEKIPGLEAQMPDSALVRWLHQVDVLVPGELRVVAGDMEGDSVVSWLKTLLADAFYWTDNDLVVQTRSMYGGAPRQAGAAFLLDHGGKVDHFSYFANVLTAEAVVNGLVQDRPPGYRRIGPLSWSGEDATGVRGARRGADDGKPQSAKPALFLLPGILGSNLEVDGKRVWLGWRIVNGLSALAYTPGNKVAPDGPIGMVYDDLVEFLSETHEVIEFAFDWRIPMEEEARRLALEVTHALDARASSGQPIRFLAHSMGGLLARTMQLECSAVWDRMMAIPGARILMLGTPNGGSWAPMQVLSGDDSFGNTLTMVGAPFQVREARAMMASFPGFLQLQAGLLNDAGEKNLAKSETWKQLATDDIATVSKRSWWHNLEIQLDLFDWGVPSQSVLDSAVALRRRLDAQRDSTLAAFSSNLLLVVGSAKFTPDGYEFHADGLGYRDASDGGDGRVVLRDALLPGVRTWTFDCEHGDLPKKKDAFDGYLELLQTGTTTKLAGLPTSARGAATAPVTHVRSRPSRVPSGALPPADQADAVKTDRPEPAAARAAGMPALAVGVVNADLRYVRQPLVIGHYEANRLTGSEGTMDRLIGGTMHQSLALGQYPSVPGTHQVFVNTRASRDNPLQAPRPAAVIVVGLGPEGKLRGSELVSTVRRGVIAWSQRIVEGCGPATLQFELAATLIGSGGSGISAGTSAQLVSQGVWEANQRLLPLGWPTVAHLQLVELYLDRATDAWRALRVQADTTPGRFVLDETVPSRTGALLKPLDAGYRGTDYDFISAVTEDGGVGNAEVVYTLDTKRARTEVRARATQSRLVRQLVKQASNDRNADAKIGETLFQLLIPVEMEPFLGGSTELVMELDASTAGIPWELLDSPSRDGGESRPWAIRSKLIRKLRTSDFRSHVVDSSKDANVLVIGEPECDSRIYPPLPSARAEACAVAELFRKVLGPERVSPLIRPDGPTAAGPSATQVLNTLLDTARPWRIVHIAGHGEPPEMLGTEPVRPDDSPPREGDPRGVVLANATYLGPREIEGMRQVPELVFVNCCHLAARNPEQVLRIDTLIGDAAKDRRGQPYDRALFAAGVAEKLIDIGVRCVVAAGWAVDDEAARTFATAFYECILRGDRFIDAVGYARAAAKDVGGNTWGAYQCYGDPDWVFTREGADAQRPDRRLGDEFGGVVSPAALQLALETIEVESTRPFDVPDDDAGDARAQQRRAAQNSEVYRAKLRHLEGRFRGTWGASGAIAERFARAWVAVGDRAAAIDWYEKARTAEDGTASMRVVEQLGNLRAREAFSRADRAGDFETARGEILRARQLLGDLAKDHASLERLNLCASAGKRLAMLERSAGRPTQEATIATRDAYKTAADEARDRRLPDFFYPALNRMAAELMLDPDWAGFDAAETEIRGQLTARHHDEPDFWTAVGLIELRLYGAMHRRAVAAERAGLLDEYDDLYARDPTPWKWASVVDQLKFVVPAYAANNPGIEANAAERLRQDVTALSTGR